MRFSQSLRLLLPVLLMASLEPAVAQGRGRPPAGKVDSGTGEQVKRLTAACIAKAWIRR